MKIEEERKAFLESKLISELLKFESYEYDEFLMGFKDKTLNLMWHSWLASANRQEYKLVPVCNHEWSIQLSGRFICDLCGEFMNVKQ